MTDWINANGESQGAFTHTGYTPKTSHVPRVEIGGAAEITFQPNGTAKMADDSGRGHQSDTGASLAGGVLDTARTAGGSQIVGRGVGPGDRVTIPGGAVTSVATAVYLGHLQRNPDGSFTETAASPFANAGPADDQTGGQTEDTPSADQPADTDATFTLGEQGEGLMTEIISTFQAANVVPAMDEAIMLGEVSEKTVNKLAAQSGLDPQQLGEKLEQAQVAFYTAAMSHMETRGVVDEDAFMPFLEGNRLVGTAVDQSASA